MESKFTITRWDATTIDETEPVIARVAVDKQYSGPMEGTSTAELTTCQPAEDRAGYVATERFTGVLEGRTGTFVFQHGGVVGLPGADRFGHVVPGSGTGELAGIAGTVRMSHELIELDYRLG